MAAEVAAIQSSTNPITAGQKKLASTSNPTKRKFKVSEIEVDLSLPEPPSKKTRRALKKGKPSQKPHRTSRHTDDDADLREDETPPPEHEAAGTQASNVRSDHGVWIGNLPFTVAVSHLRGWLVSQSKGAILDRSITRVHLPVSKNKEGKPNKGFAYVDFDDVSPKAAAMALSEGELHGRRLLIKDSKSFEGRPEKAKAEATGATGNGSKPGDNNSSNKAESESRKIFVGNLGFQTSEDDVWGHFSKCGDIDWVKIATFEDSGKCKGYGWVKFREPDAAKSAVRGFVKIKEAVEMEEEGEEGEEEDLPANDSDKVEKHDAEAETGTKTRMRKWWINRLKGRELKIELAEDDQVRYRKRFKKGDVKAKTTKDANGGGKETAHTEEKRGEMKEAEA